MPAFGGATHGDAGTKVIEPVNQRGVFVSDPAGKDAA